MLLCYDDDKAWEKRGEAALRAAMEEAVGLTHELHAKGQYISAAPLEPVSKATSVRVRDGKPIVTDGPFAETREVLGGYYLIDVPSLDEAIAIAQRHPGAPLGTVEIRPVIQLEGLPQTSGGAQKSSKGTVMPTQIFVNLPVKDLKRSMGFYEKLGFKNNPQFTDETAACMVVSDTIYVMLLTEKKFKNFTPRAICDASKATEVLNCLSCENRDEVNSLVRKAIAAGGSAYADPKDYGFMFQHGFADPDGHLWELVHMDPNATQQG
jgi:predicted lactoylglutathione lyase